LYRLLNAIMLEVGGIAFQSFTSCELLSGRLTHWRKTNLRLRLRCCFRSQTIRRNAVHVLLPRICARFHLVRASSCSAPRVRTALFDSLT